MIVNRRITCVLLAVGIILSSSITAFATSPTNGAQKNVSSSEFIIEELTPIDLSGVDPSCITKLPQTKSVALSNKREFSSELSNNIDAPDIRLSDLDTAKHLESNLSEKITLSRTVL